MKFFRNPHIQILAKMVGAIFLSLALAVVGWVVYAFIYLNLYPK